jgi:hypothetical protein
VAAWQEHALGPSVAFSGGLRRTSRLGGGPPLITRALRRSSPLPIRAAPLLTPGFWLLPSTLQFPALAAFPAFPAIPCNFLPQHRVLPTKAILKRSTYANQNHRFSANSIREFAVSPAQRGIRDRGSHRLVPGCLAGSLGGVRYGRMHWPTWAP